MPAPIPDFTAAELELAAAVVRQRYGREVPIEPAESELQLAAGDEAMVVCPTLYWSERRAHFVVCKLGAGRFRCQFFYTDADQYGTGRDEYDDLRACVLDLLRVQADHEKLSAGVASGATAVDLSGDEYTGPPTL